MPETTTLPEPGSQLKAERIQGLTERLKAERIQERLKAERIQSRLEELPGWRTAQGQSALERTYVFLLPLGDIPYLDEVEVVGELIPLPTRPFNPFTGVQGLSDLLSGRSLLAGLSSLGGRRSSNEGKPLRATSGDASGVIGFGCDDLISPAVALGAAGGALFGGAVDMLATPNRGELTFTLGFGLGGGISASPLGASTGKSEGWGLGVATVLGLPVVLNFLGSGGLSNFFGDEPLAGANVGVGVGGGEGAAGGITYTFVFYNQCE